MSIVTSIIDKVAGIATGGLAEKAFDTVKAYFPPDLTPDQQAEIKAKLQALEIEKYRVISAAMNDAEQGINERVSMYEGTAKDLLALPIIGRVILFARGAQRPIWGFAVLYMDYMVYSGKWTLGQGSESDAFWLINMLVLGFLFGERSIKNLEPMISSFSRNGQSNKRA